MTRGLLKIAAWEIKKGGASARPATIALAFTLLVGVILVAFAASQTGLHMDNDIYTVVVTDPGLKPIIESDQRFKVKVYDPENAAEIYQDQADVLIHGRNVYFHDMERSQSAAWALKKVFKQYEENLLASKGSLEDAYPVWIVSHYLKREQVFQVPTMSQEQRGQEEGPRAGETPTTGEGDGGAAGVPSPPPQAGGSTEFQTEVESIMRGGSGSLLYQEGDFTTPSHMSPPLPFRSVVLTFFFIFPMFFVAQFYSTSILQERLERRGVFLLTSPLTTLDILLGKMLPYLVATLAIAGGPRSILAADGSPSPSYYQSPCSFSPRRSWRRCSPGASRSSRSSSYSSP